MNRTIIYCLAAVAVMGAACAAGSLFFRETPQPQTYTPHATISPGSGTLSADNADDAPITTPPTTVVFDTRAQQRMEAIASDYRFEGVAIAVKDGKLISRYAAGVADYESYAPITEDSLFCVGSLAKQFTATCILMLEERGKLSVSDALGKYFPECPYGDDVTLRNLLTMRSGIAEFYETYNDGYSQNEIPAGTLAETVTNENTAEDNRNQLEQWLFAQPLVFEPGSQCVYTNSNYFLLARLVERLSGRSYEDFVRANIFEPLGMTNSGFIDEMLDDPRLAKDAREAQTVYVGITMGLGDIITNAEDMQKWLLSFSGNSLLSDDSKQKMSSDADNPGYGFGVIPTENGWSHNGVFTSYTAFDYVDPKAGSCVFAVTNNQAALRGSISEMCLRMMTELL